MNVLMRKTYEFRVVKRVKFFKNLILPMVRSSGRNSLGQIVMFGLGGGYKRYYRLIDFKRILYYVPGRIVRFEYDPNRLSFIMLIIYFNGLVSYYLAPSLVKVGKFLMTGKYILPINGNSLPLLHCLVGSFVHNVKVKSITSKIARAAGTKVQIVRKVGSMCLLRLPSKEERFITMQDYCVLGRVSNIRKKFFKYSSAGIRRRLGFRPKVRGVAKNPIDHPHGGGEGRTSGGQPSVSPWNVYTKGVRTTTRWTRFNLTRWGFFRRRTKQVW